MKNYHFKKKKSFRYVRKKHRSVAGAYVLVSLTALLLIGAAFLFIGNPSIFSRILAAAAEDPTDPGEPAADPVQDTEEAAASLHSEEPGEDAGTPSETESEEVRITYEIGGGPDGQPDRETISEDDWRRFEVVRPYNDLGIVVQVNNYLNMRSSDSTSSEVCGVIFPYCGVDILEHTDSGWYKITSGGATGYVSDKYIETGERAIALAMNHCRYMAEILEDKVEVMSSPDEDSKLITIIKKGDFFDCLSEPKGWVEIEIAEDLGGFVKTSQARTTYRLEQAVNFSDANGVSQRRRDIINTAFQYYGGKYVFGGTSLETGIDCSAFTRAIFRKNGLELSRNSWSQAMEGKHVEEEDYRPGDLLFYAASHKDGIGHVAIYIGNGKIIHAASERKGICVSDFKIVPIMEARNVLGD